MAKLINKDAVVVWQKYFDGDTELSGEPALVVKSYGEMIGIQQDDKEEILINEESFDVIIKLMKAHLKDRNFVNVKL